ncbi:hypothetical protein JBL43_00920 [Aureibaculum sp. A20]|uniref:Transglutaminase-like domain-containing protein n=1 Tax=Aureibaculum flavum TaxID=2795986 RepID=A0ABS0WLE2_9FLAO|nr:transglutaminase domain-containing protein [Aureibaculum flavum]MBJ2172778.1 hypothetical protein [Aureibaculum flavum]
MEKIKAIIIILFGISSFAQTDDFKQIDFTKADSIAKFYHGENLDNLPLLVHKLTATFTTDVEKFRAIYTWVSTNIDNDYGSAVKNQRKRKKLMNDDYALGNWNNTFKIHMFRTLLKDKKTICTGYAYLIKELSTIANINCKIIDGYGRNIDNNIGELSVPNHSWNAVFLNNKWYLSDATWSSGYTELPTYAFISDYNDGYFLTEPKLFSKSHYPLNEQWLLMQNNPSVSDFLNGPLVYGNTFKNTIIPITPATMYIETSKKMINTFTLEISESFKIEELELEISNGSNRTKVEPTNTVITDNLLNVDYQFKRTGHYDFHIKLKDEVVVTYLIKVKRKLYHSKRSSNKIKI